MAQPAGKGQAAARQKQANHFQEILKEAQAVVDDPNSSAEDKIEAQQTVTDMTANLSRLSSKYGVTPAA